MKINLIQQPNSGARLGDILIEHLCDEKKGWTVFRAAIAFVKLSGVQYLVDCLPSFAQRAAVKISVGVDQLGTTKEGLEALLDSVIHASGEIWAFRNEYPTLPTFHPKLYLFKKTDEALVILGSGNLTTGGLFTNYEAFLVVSLSLEDETERLLLSEIEEALDYWCDPAHGLAVQLTRELIEELHRRDIVPTERQSRSVERQESREVAADREQGLESIFGRISIPRPPYLARARRQRQPSSKEIVDKGTRSDLEERPQGFVMTLQRTDVGVGQTTSGASRRSPEIFIPLSARDENPGFWGWPDLFIEDPNKPGKYDRRAVPIRVNGVVVNINMMTWPDKHDFRLRNERLRSAGNVGDILRMEWTDEEEYFYDVTVVQQDTGEYEDWLRLCTTPVRNSRKRFGYY